MLPFGSPLRSELVMLFAVPLSSSLAAPVSFQELTTFTSLLNHYVHYAHGIVLFNIITESYRSSANSEKQIMISPFPTFTPFFRNSVHSASTCKSTRCLLIMLACGLSRLRDGVFVPPPPKPPRGTKNPTLANVASSAARSSLTKLSPPRSHSRTARVSLINIWMSR